VKGLAAALCLLAAAAFASDESATWVERGKGYLTAGSAGDALLCFSNAVTCDPNDPDAIGWYGVALSRTAETDADREEATQRLEEASSKGCKLPEALLETGRLRLLAKNDAGALDALDACELARPGQWQVAEWRGIVLCRLGRHEAALAAFEEAGRRGSTDTQAIDYYVGVCHRELGHAGEAKRSFEEAERASPGTAFGLAAREFLGVPAGARKWACWQRGFGGYDTNAIALGDDTQVPTGDRRRDAWFGGVAAGGWYRIDLSDAFDVVLSAEGSRTVYNEIARANTDEARLGVGADWRASERVAAHVEVTLDHTEFGYDPFQTGLTVAPSVAVEETGWLTGRVEYRYVTREVSPAFGPVLDPDGHANEVAVRQTARVPGTNLRLDLLYEHVWSVTEGKEFDYGSDGVSFAVSHPVAWGIVATGRVGYVTAGYDHASVADPAGEHRDDDIWTVQVGLRRSFGEHWSAYVSGTMVDHESDVDLYDYDRNIWGWGIEHRF